MKEENKYVTLLKVLLLVSLISLFVSMFVNVVIVNRPSFSDSNSVREFVGEQMILSIVYVILSLAIVITYTMFLITKIKHAELYASATAILFCIFSLVCFVITIAITTKYQYLGVASFLYSTYSTFLATYFTGFVIAAFVIVVLLPDVLPRLRELKRKKTKASNLHSFISLSAIRISRLLTAG